MTQWPSTRATPRLSGATEDWLGATFASGFTYQASSPRVEVSGLHLGIPRQGRNVRGVWRLGVSIMLARARQRRLQKAPVAQPGGAAVERQEPVVDRENIALFDPEWLFLFRRHVSLCQRVQRVAITAHDFFRLRHFLLERRIVRREPVIAVPRLDQKKPLPVVGLQAVDHFFRQNDAQRVAELADFEFNHAPLLVLLQL